MFRYEWKKLTRNRFFIAIFVFLFLVNVALVYMESPYEPGAELGDLAPELEKYWDMYIEDPVAFEARYEELLPHYEATTESGGDWTEEDWECWFYQRVFNFLGRLQEYVNTYPEDLHFAVIAAELKQEDLLATGVLPTDYEYEYQQEIIDIYSVNGLIPLKAEYLRGWDDYFSYISGNVLLVMLLLVLAPSLCIDEHASGMYPILHATKRGRLATILCKLGVLLSTVVASVLLYTGVALAFYGVNHGFSSMDNYIQAFEMFKLSPTILTVAEYLLLSIAEKILVLFAMGALFLLLATVIKKYALTFVAGLGIVGVNLVLHFVESWDMASLAGTIQLVGCFTVMDTNTAFTRYRALNLFNNTASYLPSALILYAAIAVVCAVAAIWFFCRTPGAGHRKTSDKERRRLRLPAVAIPLPGRTLVGTEMHKNLISNKYILVIVAVLLLKGFLSGTNWVYEESFEDSVYREYMVNLEGELNDDKIAIMQAELDRFAAAEENFHNAVGNHGSMTDEEYAAIYDEYSYAQQRKELFARIEAQRAHIEALAAEGKDAHFVYDTGWQAVFAQEFDWLLYGLILLLFAGVFAEEFRGGTPFILRATKRGRGRVFAAKYVTSLILATVLFATFCAIDLRNAHAAFDLRAMHSPLASMANFAALPEMSILQYLILTHAVKYLAVMALATLIIGVSLLTKKTLNTLTVVAIGTILPYLLRRLGLAVAGYVDYTYLLDGNRFLHTSVAHPLYLVLFTAAVVAAVAGVTVVGKLAWVDAGIRRRRK